MILSGGKTTYLAQQFLKSLQGNPVATFTETWVTLFTTPPTSDTLSGIAAAVEWSPDVARIRVNAPGASEPHWISTPEQTDEGAQLYVQGPIQWADIAGLSETVTVKAVGIFSASSGGQLLYWQNLSKDRSVSNGDTMLFPTGSLKVTEK